MKAAIFDMDGTLLDSLGMWYGLAPTFLNQHGIAWTKQLINRIHGMEFPEAAQYFAGHYPQLGMTSEQLIEEWDNMLHLGYLNKVKPKPHVIDYLQQLNKKNIPCAVATMTRHTLADPALSHHGISDLVEFILTPEDVGGIGKDQPNIYLEAARRLNTTAAQCVVFEDTLFCMETATKAGFTVWAIDDPLQPDRQKIEMVCHRYINNFSQLLNSRAAD